MADLNRLIRAARTKTMTVSERAEQRRNFAFGSTKIENDRITRDTVSRAEDDLIKALKADRKK